MPDSVYTSALGGLLLLQDTYGLKVDDLKEGRIQLGDEVFRADYRLSIADMHNLGVHAAKRGWFDPGRLFFRGQNPRELFPGFRGFLGI